LSELSPNRIFAQYRDKIQPYQPVPGRKYTITHSDTTGQLFVFIAGEYAEDQINEMRQEVRLEWQKAKRGYVLSGSVQVDINGYDLVQKCAVKLFTARCQMRCRRYGRQTGFCLSVILFWTALRCLSNLCRITPRMARRTILARLALINEIRLRKDCLRNIAGSPFMLWHG